MLMQNMCFICTNKHYNNRHAYKKLVKSIGPYTEVLLI